MVCGSTLVVINLLKVVLLERQVIRLTNLNCRSNSVLNLFYFLSGIVVAFLNGSLVTLYICSSCEPMFLNSFVVHHFLTLNVHFSVGLQIHVLLLVVMHFGHKFCTPLSFVDSLGCTFFLFIKFDNTSMHKYILMCLNLEIILGLDHCCFIVDGAESLHHLLAILGRPSIKMPRTCRFHVT